MAITLYNLVFCNMVFLPGAAFVEIVQQDGLSLSMEAANFASGVSMASNSSHNA